ncbi:hypothetical protein CW733_12795 [Lacinutrix sp. Bg11-31]|nr:hypothetical protein CW733_12795 [Lacinutrix sp. Bg11-31]
MFSCKEEEKSKTSNQTQKIEVKKEVIAESKNNNIKLNFKGKFESDDNFLLMYSTEENKRYSNENRLTKRIKGSNKEQNIQFEFPEGVRPYDLRIDFSGNKDQKKVSFKEIVISDSLNRILLNENNIFNNFKLSEHSKFNKETLELKCNLFNTKEGKMGYNPYLGTNYSFLKVLKAFNKANINKSKTVALEDVENIDLKDGEFRVIIEGVFKSDDELLLFYSDDLNKSFKLKKPIRKLVKGSNLPQTVIITLPNEDYLVNFRFDVSASIKQKGIEINRFTISELNSIISFDKAQISEYLKANEYIDLSSNGEINLKTIIKNGVENFNPYFNLTDKFIKELSNF